MTFSIISQDVSYDSMCFVLQNLCKRTKFHWKNLHDGSSTKIYIIGFCIVVSYMNLQDLTSTLVSRDNCLSRRDLALRKRHKNASAQLGLPGNFFHVVHNWGTYFAVAEHFKSRGDLRFEHMKPLHIWYIRRQQNFKDTKKKSITAGLLPIFSDFLTEMIYFLRPFQEHYGLWAKNYWKKN